MTAGALTIVIADDQLLLRAGFRKLLDGEDGLEVVGDAAERTGGAPARRAVAAECRTDGHPDARPERDRGARLISQRFPGTAVLVLTTYDLDEYVFAALDAGASGFLLKDCPPDELTSAIHVVARGLSSGELSTELFIGEATVKSHVSSLLNNLGCRDRVRLVVTAYEAGLVTPGSP